MKKILRIPSLLGLLFSITGCVHDKYDNCPSTGSYNVSLGFSLRDDKGYDVFDSEISTVDVGIYSNDGALLTVRHLSRAELSRFRGIGLTLDPGMYHVVGWGNIEGDVRYEGVDTPHPQGPYVTYCNTNPGEVTNAGKVYYAPRRGDRISGADISGAYRMTVDPVTGHAGVLELTAAHRIVRIYIEGFSGTPAVELSGLPEGLAWCGMGWLTDGAGSKLALAASMETTTEEKDGVVYDYAAFDTFYFDADNDIVLNVTDLSMRETAFSITLNEALNEAGFQTGIVISIVLKFTQTGVEVSLPRWESGEVEAGLET